MGVETDNRRAIPFCFVEKGARSAEEKAAAGRAVMVTGFNGGNCNSSSGDVSFGIEGLLIKNGKVDRPVAEMNITGNMLTVWNRLVEVGNDPRTCSAWEVPSLLFAAVDFSGL
jgi:PmbA protein